MKQNITILGSTGSIGTSTLDVLSNHLDRFQVFALTASKQVDVILAQCAKFKPKFAVMAQEDAGGGAGASGRPRRHFDPRLGRTQRLSDARKSLRNWPHSLVELHRKLGSKGLKKRQIRRTSAEHASKRRETTWTFPIYQHSATLSVKPALASMPHCCKFEV